MSADIAGCHTGEGGAPGNCWVETRDAAQCPTGCRTPPSESHPALNVTSVMVGILLVGPF